MILSQFQTKGMRKGLLLISTLCAGLLMVQGASGAVPKLQPERVSQLKSRATGLISEAANRRLMRAHELATEEKYADAIELLTSYLDNTSIRANEKAQFQQNLGFVLAQKGDYSKAIKYLQDALKANQLPYSPTLSTQFALAQLYLAKEEYNKAIEAIQEWFKIAESPKPESYIVLATAYSQTGKKQEALALVEKAIAESEKPSESWLLFALGLNFEMEKWAKCAEYLEYLTAQYPKKSQYWKQLAGVYLNLDKNAKALAVLELAYKQGHLEKEGEFVNLAALLIDQGIPLKAAQILEKKIEEGVVTANRRNLELMADSYLAAREVDKAMVALEKAANKADDGKVMAKRGQLLLDQEKWKLAAESLSEAIRKGNVSSPEQVYLGIGIAQFNLQNYQSALEAFQKAQKEKEDFRAARQWISYVESTQASLGQASN